MICIAKVSFAFIAMVMEPKQCLNTAPFRVSHRFLHDATGAICDVEIRLNTQQCIVGMIDELFIFGTVRLSRIVMFGSQNGDRDAVQGIATQRSGRAVSVIAICVVDGERDAHGGHFTMPPGRPARRKPRIKAQCGVNAKPISLSEFFTIDESTTIPKVESIRSKFSRQLILNKRKIPLPIGEVFSRHLGASLLTSDFTEMMSEFFTKIKNSPPVATNHNSLTH